MKLFSMFLQPVNLIWGLINAAFVYAFFYYLLHCIKNKVNLYQAALILTIIISLVIITCPIVNHMAMCHMRIMDMMEMQ